MAAGSIIAATVLGIAIALSCWWLRARFADPDLLMLCEDYGDLPNVPEGLWGTRGELCGKGKDARVPHRHADTGPVAHHDGAGN